MIHVKDDFAKGPVSQVPTAWFNAVGKFINNLVGGHGIKVSKNGDSTPSVVEIDPTAVVSSGIRTDPASTKGISAHSPTLACTDYYDYGDQTTPATLTFPDWQRYLDMPGDHVPPDRLTGADNTTKVGWERGKTAWKNGEPVDETHPAVGCSVTVCTHMRQIAIQQSSSTVYKYQAMFSRFEFDENGLLVRVVPCTNWYTMM